MAETLAPQSPLAEIMKPGRHGAAAEPPGVIVCGVHDMAWATLIARRGHLESVQAACRQALGVTPPDSPRIEAAGDVRVIWSGPNQWLLGRCGTGGHAFAERLKSIVNGLAAISDQTDGRCVLRVGGPAARTALAKIVPIDLHAKAFSDRTAAMTKMALINVQIWRLDGAFEIAVPSSYAHSAWRAFYEAALEFGLLVEA